MAIAVPEEDESVIRELLELKPWPGKVFINIR
jgi:hypothetical protein